MKLTPIWLISVIFMLHGCGGGGGGGGIAEGAQVPEPPVTTETNPAVDPLLSERERERERELKWVYDKMKSEYLWYDETPVLDYLDYASAEDLLDAMIVQEKDRFSYITSVQNNDSNQTATSTTYGMRVFVGSSITVARVYQGSSAKDEGIERADTIVRVGDVSVTDSDSAEAAFRLIADTSPGSTVDIEFEREFLANSFVRTLDAREVSRQTIDGTSTRTIGNGSTMGYLNISEFRTKTDNELRSAFKFFAEQSTTQLIIDLRLNRGGSLRTIGLMGSLILGNEPAGSTFIDFKFSDMGEVIFENGPFTTSYELGIEPNALPIERVHIITSNRTCSASEVLINSLRAYMDVSVSGITTCGKPFGFYGRQFEEKSVLWAINFQSDNALGEGGWVDGIEPTCELGEYQVFPYGDTRDVHLASAIRYLETGSCGTVTAATARSEQDDREVYYPQWKPFSSEDRI